VEGTLYIIFNLLIILLSFVVVRLSFVEYFIYVFVEIYKQQSIVLNKAKTLEYAKSIDKKINEMKNEQSINYILDKIGNFISPINSPFP
jgi:HJR/Mrr/RecB family endonuclease